MRHDFARMVILHRFGGFYVDMDNVALKSFEPLTEYKMVLSSIKHIKPKHREFVINDFMGFKPKHPLTSYYLNQCQENYLQKKSIDVYREWKVRFVTQTTGPKFFSRLLKKYYPNYTPMQLAYMNTKDTLQKYWKDDNLELNKEDYYFEEKFAGSWIKSMI
jgi:mannosyltransferase OCH1-like enzyme